MKIINKIPKIVLSIGLLISFSSAFSMFKGLFKPKQQTDIPAADMQKQYGTLTLPLPADVEKHRVERRKKSTFMGIELSETADKNLYETCQKVGMQLNDHPTHAVTPDSLQDVHNQFYKFGANPNFTTLGQSRALLQVAPYPKALPIVQLLLDWKADPNVKNICQDTPLHLAIHKQNSDAVNLLLQAKGDLSVRGHQNLAPLSYLDHNDSATAIVLLHHTEQLNDAIAQLTKTRAHAVSKLRAALDSSPEMSTHYTLQQKSLKEIIQRSMNNCPAVIRDIVISYAAPSIYDWADADRQQQNQHDTDESKEKNK